MAIRADAAPRNTCYRLRACVLQRSTRWISGR